MAIDPDSVLAGISAAGASGAELAWFAPAGTTAPTDATTTLASAVNEQQTVTITGTPAGGTFTLTYAGQTTAGIAYNANAAAVQSALVALSTIGTGNVTVTGGPGPGTPYVVTFAGPLAGTDLAQMTASGASLTGGTSPDVAVTTTTAGASGWYSGGLITEDGLTVDLSNSSNDIRAYGLSAPIRKIVTDETITFKVVFMESTPIPLSIYYRLPLVGADAIIVDSSGDFSVTEGTFRSQRWAACFDIVDGDNIVRKYCPSVEATELDGFTVKAGEAILYGTTLTAYPNSSGVSVETFYHLPGLAA